MARPVKRQPGYVLGLSPAPPSSLRSSRQAPIDSGRSRGNAPVTAAWQQGRHWFERAVGSTTLCRQRRLAARRSCVLRARAVTMQASWERTPGTEADRRQPEKRLPPFSISMSSSAASLRTHPTRLERNPVASSSTTQTHTSSSSPLRTDRRETGCADSASLTRMVWRQQSSGPGSRAS